VIRRESHGDEMELDQDTTIEKLDEDGPKVVRRLNKRTRLPVEEPEKARRTPSPARNSVSKIVHVWDLTRPFTLPQLKELLGRTGTLEEGGFWIDKIKSHCFVTYESEDDAQATRAALHGTRWPSSNPKTLKVDYATESELEIHREGAAPPPAQAVKRERREERTSVREERKKDEKTRDRDRDKERSRRRSRSQSPDERSRSRDLSREKKKKSGKEGKDRRTAG